MTSPAGTGAPAPADAHPKTDYRPAPWVRTRLRSAPLAALLMAALAFGTVFLAVAFPRVLDRGNDDALRELLRSRGPGWTSMVATSNHRFGTADLDQVAVKLAARTGKTFHYESSGLVYGVRSNTTRPLVNPGLAKIDEAATKLNLLYLNGLTEHATLASGRWPGGGTETGPVPIALSTNAAATIGAKLGDILETGGPEEPQAELVGLYTPNDLHDPYWTDLSCAEAACLSTKGGWQTAGVVGGDALSRIEVWGYGAVDFWRMPVDTAALRADLLPETNAEVASFLAGPTGVGLAVYTGRQDLAINSTLPQLFKQATAQQAAAAPVAAIGPAGLAGVAAVVLCLAAALTADRRAAELRLLQARGGSRGGVLLRLLGEGAVVLLPAAAVATALALVLFPTPRWTGAVLAGLATTLLALLSFPVRASVLWSAPRALGGRRRLVAESAVLAVTVAAVLAVRRHGVAPPGEGLDPLLVAAPLLLALTGGLLLARLQPLLVGALARLAGRRPGLVGFLGLARAARGTGGRTGPPMLPLLALLLAVTTAGFGATVLDTIDSGRLRSARIATGGDASLAVPIGVNLSPGFLAAAAALPGVRTAVPAYTESEGFLLGTGDGSTRTTVVVVEPEAYAELSRTVGRGEFDPAVLAGGTGGADSPVPALFSTELAKKGMDGNHRLRLPNGGELVTTAAGTVDGTPALPGLGRRFVVLPAGPAVARVPELGHLNVWLATGDVDERQLKGLVRTLAASIKEGAAAAADWSQAVAPASSPTSGSAKPSVPASSAPAPASTSASSASAPAPASADPDAVPNGYLVKTSATVAAELAADPLQRSASRLFWVAVIGAAAFALLAVLLTLLRAAPERVALLARLRTMGLRPRQGLALIVAETLPQTLVAAFGGGLVALAAVALLGSAFDLSVLIGADVPVGLRLTVMPVLVQTLGLAALVSVGVLAEAFVSGRRQITTELRAGDQR
ncbi:hypothetical protein [Kitasatospora sp. NPDC092286]|uniref:hypothetical protein n=1 Tax=Kitasatospora sp. NPDC092286 TaxID=3364087 RepID=UPI003822AF08